MWFERFVIIVTVAAPRLPAVELGLLPPTLGRRADASSGSFGLFFTLFLLFCRYLPMVAMAEVKSVMPQAHLELGVHQGHGDYWGDFPKQHEEQDGRRDGGAP